MNISFIIGCLGADAEIKEANGAKFITLSIADKRKVKRNDGSTQVVTNWVDAIIANPEHPVLPYLKQGVRVAIVGNSDLRVYSSKKDRCMKAGQTIHVVNIELCGGLSDVVPGQLINPNDGSIHDVTKYYRVEGVEDSIATGGFMKMVDAKGREFDVNHNGWVAPVQDEKPMNQDEMSDKDLIDVV